MMNFFNQTPAVDGEQLPVAAAPESIKYPYEIYNQITFRCFDVCIANFDNKSLDYNEQHCVEECVYNLKEAPYAFQKSHQFEGFLAQDELKSNK